jgi:hypothetical protein
MLLLQVILLLLLLLLKYTYLRFFLRFETGRFGLLNIIHSIAYIMYSSGDIGWPALLFRPTREASYVTSIDFLLSCSDIIEVLFALNTLLRDDALNIRNGTGR